MTTYNDLLNEFGTPINRSAKTSLITHGDPIYLIADSPFSTAYPELKQVAKDISLVDMKWQHAINELMSFYKNSQYLSSTPIWLIDENKLSVKREALLNNFLQNYGDKVLVCYLDRFINKHENTVQIHANRGLLLQDNRTIVRSDVLSTIVERPGSAYLSDQIQHIKQAYKQSEAKGIILIDTGLASGNSISHLNKLFTLSGMNVIKFFGGVGWYPKGFEKIKELDPECLLWFDLSKGGWIETRDYFILPNAGIPLAKKDPMTSIETLYREVFNGDDIGFTLPYMSFFERWFRLGDVSEVRDIIHTCYELTKGIYTSFGNNITIKNLQDLYKNTNQLFLLPIHFGDIDEQITQLQPNIDIVDYIDEYYKRLRSSS